MSLPEFDYKGATPGNFTFSCNYANPLGCPVIDACKPENLLYTYDITTNPYNDPANPATWWNPPSAASVVPRPHLDEWVASGFGGPE